METAIEKYICEKYGTNVFSQYKNGTASVELLGELEHLFGKKSAKLKDVSDLKSYTHGINEVQSHEHLNDFKLTNKHNANSLLE